MTITSKPSTDDYRAGWDRIFCVKYPHQDCVPLDQRPCECGHGIFDHEDFDGGIHECNYRGCPCGQFKDKVFECQ